MAGKKVIVIGAGAAGLMAAAAAAEAGAQVTVLEKNEKAGKKIYITGKGRCNLTNDCDPEAFLSHVVRNPRFLYSSLYGFDQHAVMDFLTENGCPVKTERGDRVFPVSDHASDVTKALVGFLSKQHVKIRYRCTVKEILTREEPFAQGEDDKVITAVTGVRLENGDVIPADSVILCTGGLSYPSTGSTGDGYRMAQDLGLSVLDTAPSLVPLETREEWCRRLQGLALKNVRIKVFPPKGMKGKRPKPVYEGFGELLFTHFGVSGPLILTASCYCDFSLKKSAGTEDSASPVYQMFLDLKPAIPEEELTQRLQKEFSAAGPKHFPGALRPLFPARLAEEMAQLTGLGPERTAASVTAAECRKLASFFKAVPVTLTGTRGFAEAVITRGGISTKEFDPHTMECKKIRGLFAAGEVLDLDAHTGGFNLQIAWSTGHLAGISSAEGQPSETTRNGGKL